MKANSPLLSQRDVCVLYVCTCLLLCFQGTFHWSKIPSDRPHEVKGPQTSRLPAAWLESILCLVVFELQILRDSWKWMWSCLKRIKTRPWLCSARGQRRCYGGNDLVCHRTSVSVLTWTEVTELLSAFCRDLISLLHVNEKFHVLKSV